MQRIHNKKRAADSSQASQAGMFRETKFVKKQKEDTPEDLFNLAQRNISQANYLTSYHHFIKCEKLLSANLKATPDGDEANRLAVMSMQALENAAWLQENDSERRPKRSKESQEAYDEACLVERRKALAMIGNRAQLLNKRFHFIDDIEYQLGVLRTTFGRNDIIWDDVIEYNELSPRLSKNDLTENLEPHCVRLRDMIDASVDLTEKMRNMYLSRLARATICLGAAYLYVAEHKRAASAYMLALSLLSRMTIKDKHYLHHLYTIFHTLNQHINIDNEFAILMFMRRLMIGLYEPTFNELSAMFLPIETAQSPQNPLKMALWYLSLDIIKSRIDAGNLSEKDNVTYLRDFPMTPFWDALINVGLESRFSEMFEIVRSQVQQTGNEYLKALNILPKPNRLPDLMQVAQIADAEPLAKKHNSGQDFNSALVQQGFFSCGSEDPLWQQQVFFGVSEDPENFSNLVISDDEFERMMGFGINK